MSTSIADLVVNVSTNIASLNDGMNRVADVVSKTANQLKGSFDEVKDRIESTQAALEKLAVVATAGFGAEAFKEFVSSIIETQAHLQDLAVKVGSTASEISSLAPAAKLSGTNLDDVALAVGRFTKNLATAQDGTGKVADALKNLGFNTSQFAELLKHPLQGLVQLSQNSQQFANDGNRLSNQIVVLGKSAENLVPFMKQLAESGQIQATVSDQQAAAAHNLVDQWTELSLRSDALKNSIAAGIVPALSSALKGFTDATTGAGSFSDTIKGLAQDGSLGIWLVELIKDIAIATESLITIGKALVAFGGSVETVVADVKLGGAVLSIAGGNTQLVTQLPQLLADRNATLEDANKRYESLWNDDVTKVSTSLTKSLDDLQKWQAAYKKTLDAQAVAVRDYAANSDANDRKLQEALAGTNVPSANAPTATASTAKVDQFTQALQKFREMAAEAGATLSQLFDGTKLNAAQQAFAKLAATDAWTKFTAGQKAALQGIADTASAALNLSDVFTRFKALSDDLDGSTLGVTKDFQTKLGTLQDAFNAGYISLQRYVDLTQKLLNQQPFAKAQTDALKEMAKQEQAVIDLMGKMQEEANKALSAYADQNTRLQDEIKLIGLSDDDRARALVLLDAQADRQKLINASDADGLAILDQQIAKRQDLVTIAAQSQRLSDAYTSVFKSLSDETATFFENFVEHGTSAFKTLWDDFKSYAIKALAEIAAQKIIVQIAGSIGLGGTATNALAGQNPLGTILGGGNSLGGLSGIGSAISGLFGASDFTAALAGDAFLPGALGAAGEGVATFGATLGAGLGAFSAALGTAIPVLGLIIGAASLLGAFSHGGPKTGGSAAGGIDLSTGLAPDTSTIDRYFTPNTADATVKTIVDSVTATYAQVAKQIGLTAGSAVFNLGFDEDPQGTANSRVSGGAFVNGAQAFNQRDVDAGQGDTNVQADLALEAQRALLAALQASDLPDYLASIFSSVDAASATSDQINQIISTAEALKQAVTIVSGLGDQFSNLDPTAIEGLVSAFGGLQNFSAGFAYVGQNFTTTADRMTQAQAQLTSSFAQLGLAVPKTHQQFLDLLNSLDLTTSGGQQTEAALVSLAPLFVEVAGTADQAAAALQAQADATQKVIDSAASFLQSNFYNTAEAQAQKLAADSSAIADASAQLGVAIPTTLDGFRDLVTGIDQSTDAGKALYDALIVLAPAIFDVATSATSASTATSGAAEAMQQVTAAAVGIGQAIGEGAAAADSFIGSIQAVTGSMGSSFDTAAKLTQSLSLLAPEIASVQQQVNADPGRFQPNNEYTLQLQGQLADLQSLQQDLTQQLAEFTIWKAQYGASVADQLVQLTNSYNEQAPKLSANAAALQALQEIYNTNFQAIVNATKTGVDGTLDNLQTLRDGIASYLQGLQVGNISPLTPTQKYNQALSDFQGEFAKAQTGDQGALGDVSHFSDTLLNLGRDMFASGQQYTDLFNLVTGELGTLTSPTPKGDPLAAALPVNGSPLASSDDIKGLGVKVDTMTASMQELVAALADSNTDDALATVAAVERNAQQVSDSLKRGTR